MKLDMFFPGHLHMVCNKCGKDWIKHVPKACV